MRTIRQALAAVGAVILLAGCPGGIPGISGASAPDPKVLAVTTKDDQGITTSQVLLTWGAVTNAATYHVSRKVGDGTAKVLVTTDKTQYTDNVNANLTLTYTVQAFAANGDDKGSSSPKVVQVPDAKVAKASSYTVDKNAASSDTVGVAKSSKPDLAWADAASANAYFVTVTEVGDGGNPGKVVYAAFSKTANATVGTLSQPDLSLPGYTQTKGDGLIKGKNYFMTVTAIRADSDDLTKASAFDVAQSDAPAKLSFF